MPADLLRRLHPGRLGLRARMVLYGTALTAAVVAAAFVAATWRVSANTRQLLAEELAASQHAVLEQERLTREQLLRTSGLVTNNSTLRAALETFRLESTYESRNRPDLLATIQHEVGKIAIALGQDLLAVTDDQGVVLAASDSRGAPLNSGEDLSRQPILQTALNQSAPVGEQNFALLELDGRRFQVICVPIVLQGYIIGTLTHGNELDEEMILATQSLLGGEIVVTIDGRPVASTLPPDALAGASLQAGGGGDEGPDGTLHLNGEEFVAASISMGTDSEGRPVRMHVLHSLSRRLDQANRSLFLIFTAYGLGALGLAGLLAAAVSRSILRPLQAFVGFMRSVGERGDPASRFTGDPGSPEVATLNDAYNQMMDSLESTRAQLTGAREDLQRLERLKEGEKMAALGRMLSGAAHEINNPLSAVVGNIELILRKSSPDGYARERMEKALREGRRVAALVKNLLKLSRRSDEQRSPVDLNRAITESLSVCRHDFANSGITIEEELAGGDLTVLGSELELQQVFLNLLRNALDALTERGGPGSLQIRTRTEGGRAVATVADDGPGIKDPAKVLEPFFTTKEIGKGTGLGLPICLGIIEGHGGILTVENRETGGAIFTIDLPLHQEAAAPAPGRTRPEERSAEPATGLDISVLVVDDEPSVLELQVDVLESNGAQVTAASSGRKALEILRHATFDLVITDLRMPGGVSGRDLYQWIKEERPGDESRVVFVTGDTMAEDSQEFLEALPNKCLIKPFLIQEYLAVLKEAIHEPVEA